MDVVVLRWRARRSDHSPARLGVTARPNLLAGEDLPPPPVQKRSADRRSRLKSAAIALFAAKGYEGTSIEEVAGQAGVAVGGFYQHFRSKRQLLLALMDEFLERMSGLQLRPGGGPGVRAGLHSLLSHSFSMDVQYLGVYRAWQEAVLADPALVAREQEIHAWTTARVLGVLQLLQGLPGARPGVDITALAPVLDAFFWSLIAQAVQLPRVELDLWIESATHLVYHALFSDNPADCGGST